VLKQQLGELGMTDQCIFCLDGDEALEASIKTIKECVAKCKDRSHVENIKPIALLMVDF